MSIILYIFKAHLIIIYFFIKIFTIRKKQVLFLSRQSSNIPLNYELLMNKLDDNKIEYKFICKKIESSINDSVRTYGNYSNTSSVGKKIIANIKSAFNYYISIWQQMVLIAKSKVIIVDGYNIPVSLLKHKKGTKVIQMWHALGAIKKFGYQAIGKKDGVPEKISKIMRMHANYDYILSGSDGMSPFFAEAFNTPIEKLLPIGTPIVDYIKSKNNKDAKKLYDAYPELKKKINVLYSPTFRNDKTNNNQEVFEKFDFEKCNLIVTNHFKVETDIKDDRVIYIPSDKFTVFDVLVVVDYVITDYSALMIDAAIANRKILLYPYDNDKYSRDNGVNINLLEEWSKLSFTNIEEIVNIIVKEKYDMEVFNKFKKRYTPNIRNSSTDEIIKLIGRCLDE